MQIRQLSVRNFRGISTLDWSPNKTFCCLIGSGDCGKSTLLDAIEAVLSPRWFIFMESDFYRCNSREPIEIKVTVGELSRALLSDERFGLFIRGWSSTGALRDEPEDDDEPVLTARLTVDATMEPSWEVVCDRIDDPRTLSNRDRALFGLVRLAGDDARQLTWGQGSILAKLTGDTDEAAGRLAEAYRSARDSAQLNEIDALAQAAASAESFAKALGAYVQGKYAPGLELGRSGLSSGSIALHDDGVPLRLAGLGTRRLATLAIQKSAIKEGAIVLVDEIEHGLEPHRIVGALSQLKSDQVHARSHNLPVGQILLTTHSDVALAEAGSDAMMVLNCDAPSRSVAIATPDTPEAIRPLLRFMPRALFARRILVTEGNTEVGLLMGLRENWVAAHQTEPIEQRGAAIADGNGSQAVQIALQLAKLGYKTAIYRDSDETLAPGQRGDLTAAGVPVIEYEGKLNTEMALFSAASDEHVQALLDFARNEHGRSSIDATLANELPDLDIDVIETPFENWSLFSELTPGQLRATIAEVAAPTSANNKKNRRAWFKDQRIARDLAPLAWQIATSNPGSAIARALAAAETWLYA